ncbi:aminoglycoside phosphotransferase family protein [Micromonospora sp. WMMD714]|uniref:aminoglycoside phosphotransferase family protein n=1 Tax=Micromonospora sp. WMMD714 TaxID=3016097 RepID=UPI002499D61D|nr:aminoglycoside phosphotransferase family protein [Micromonospora sp. WMMD714]WFE67087.1 aminoglycoside phosphotransferase family protein [Micromonospora sp. WMMD714]
MSDGRSNDIPDLGPPPERIVVDADQVRRLVAAQFPQWAGLPVERVANGGWDNWTFHLGPGMSVRLPSALEYAEAVDKEHIWLPVLASQLPLPISTPLAKGEPGEGYPYPWSVCRWLDGQTARRDRIADPVRFALDLAEFVAALQDIDAAGGPRPGRHNWYRGGTLRTYHEQASRGLRALGGRIDTGLADEIWECALDAGPNGVERWFHGDLAQENILLDDGHLAGIIDFGTCGVGDPSCDLAVAWTLLTTDGRRVFRERLPVEDATWARGRGWALWKTLVTYANAPDDSEVAANSRRILDEIFAEYTDSEQPVKPRTDRATRPTRPPPMP